MAGRIAKALVVDDSRLARLALTKQLQRHNIQVDAAVSGGEALAYLQHTRPDVIFLDYMMPDMDGFEAAAQLLQRDPSLEIVMYTSQDTAEDKQRAAEVGIRGFLSKPSSDDALAQVLREIAGAAKGGAPSQPASGPAPAAVSIEDVRRVAHAVAVEAAQQACARELELLRLEFAERDEGEDAEFEAMCEAAVAAAAERAEEVAAETARREAAQAARTHSHEAVLPLLDQLRSEVSHHTANLAHRPEFKTQVKGVMFEHLLPTLREALRPQVEALVGDAVAALRTEFQERLAAQRKELREQIRDVDAQSARQLAELERKLARFALIGAVAAVAAITLAVIL